MLCSPADSFPFLLRVTTQRENRASKQVPPHCLILSHSRRPSTQTVPKRCLTGDGLFRHALAVLRQLPAKFSVNHATTKRGLEDFPFFSLASQRRVLPLSEERSTTRKAHTFQNQSSRTSGLGNETSLRVERCICYLFLYLYTQRLYIVYSGLAHWLPATTQYTNRR